jgi:hypothetical protein
VSLPLADDCDGLEIRVQPAEHSLARDLDTIVRSTTTGCHHDADPSQAPSSRYLLLSLLFLIFFVLLL